MIANKVDCCFTIALFYFAVIFYNISCDATQLTILRSLNVSSNSSERCDFCKVIKKKAQLSTEISYPCSGKENKDI